MINIENSKKELINHVHNLELNNPRVEMKIGHVIRVAENCKKIAVDLSLTEEQIQLAELIGLLHDIGRFEQYIIFNEETKVVDNIKKFDHGEAGVEVLKKDDYIRKYIDEDIYDNVIYTAIYEHNKYELAKGLSKEEELFSKIIKDADKLDLIYESNEIYWKDSERIKQVEEGKLSEKMLKDFYECKLADSRNKISETDQILRFASFIFDINFPCSFKILKENDNIGKMIDRFNYQVPNTREEMMNVKKIANEYINKRV
jgi:putative nucleotidyltransferase with HDIG domain